jgi:hypothetical protein
VRYTITAALVTGIGVFQLQNRSLIISWRVSEKMVGQRAGDLFGLRQKRHIRDSVVFRRIGAAHLALMSNTGLLLLGEYQS